MEFTFKIRTKTLDGIVVRAMVSSVYMKETCNVPDISVKKLNDRMLL